MLSQLKISSPDSLPNKTDTFIKYAREHVEGVSNKEIKAIMNAMKEFIYDAAFDGNGVTVTVAEKRPVSDGKGLSATRHLFAFIDVCHVLSSSYHDTAVFQDKRYSNIFFRFKLINLYLVEAGFVLTPIRAEIKKRMVDALINDKTKTYIENGEKDILKTNFTRLGGRGRAYLSKASTAIDTLFSSRN